MQRFPSNLLPDPGAEDMNWKNIDTKEKVASELALVYFLWKIFVGGTNQSEIAPPNDHLTQSTILIRIAGIPPRVTGTAYTAPRRRSPDFVMNWSSIWFAFFIAFSQFLTSSLNRSLSAGL
jgi:hypothetical protein